MKHPNEQKRSCVLQKLTTLPSRIVAIHDHENLAEFVLHELCDPTCIPIRQAAFFLDNPEFDCLKGIAGCSERERYQEHSIWEKRDEFSQHMKQSPFNQRVRSTARGSVGKKKGSWQDDAREIATLIELDGHEWCIFGAKHGNTGLLVFQSDEASPEMRELLAMGVSLLALCPAF